MTPALEHGQRRGYLAGCRCTRCLVASAQSRACYRSQAGPRPHHALVDASEAKGHLQELQRLGVGYRQAARLAGLNPGFVRDIRSGRVLRIRQSTSARLLAVRPVLARGSQAPQWPTARTVNALKREGYSLADLATRLQLHPSTLQFDDGHVKVATALKVRAFYLQVTADGEPAA